MNKELFDYKEKILSAGFLRHQTGQQYTCQCPFCNDNRKHCYVLIKMTDDTPVLFNCFKCNAHGIVNDKFLEYFGINDIKSPKNSFSRKLDINNTASTKIPDAIVSEKDNIEGICQYIHGRVGQYPTLQELQFFQYVGRPIGYAKEYLGCDNTKIFRNRNWFRLTNGNIIGRWKDDDTEMRWLRYKSNRAKGSGLYTIKIPFDMYQDINVIIAEGIMDVIGLYYNYHEFSNCVYIASMGKNYERGIKHIMDKGIFGDSVNIKIFKDPDVNVDSIRIDGTLQKMFKRVDIYENLKGLDYGVDPSDLDIHKIIRRNIR